MMQNETPHQFGHAVQWLSLSALVAAALAAVSRLTALRLTRGYSRKFTLTS